MSSSNNQLNFNKKSFVVLTGGSRGIGATIAIEFAKKLAGDSTIVLLARTIEGLNDTKNQIEKINSALKVVTHSIDLTHPSKDELKKVLEDSKPSDYEQAIVVHNAGSTGDVSKRAIECNDVQEWQENFAMNVFSVILLNNIFCELTKGVQRYVINITSKAAIDPFVTFGFYCPNKAAREMFFRVLSMEEPSLIVLNYAPGPVDTKMLRDVGTHGFDEGIKTFVAEGLVDGRVLSTEQTTTKLLSILEKGNYKSGDHVDYFDE